MRKLVIALLVMCAGGVSLAEGVGVDFTTDFYSKYVWRGQNIVDDWVVQPGVSTTIENVTLGIWGNVDMTEENSEEWNFTEVDYYVDYSASLTDGIGYSIGYIYYDFPRSEAETQEIYGGLSFDTVLSPSVTWYYDIEDVEGSYVALGLGHSVDEFAKLSEDTPIGLEVGLNIGWGDSDYNAAYFPTANAGDGMNDLTLSFAFPMELGSWSVTPSLTYVTLLDSSIASSKGDDDQLFFAGIGLGTSF